MFSLAELANKLQIEPAEILASRRWDAALFTTYAFSISFFESVVFQALTKRTPCHDICVLIDADGYVSSLMERGASRVGRDYTLIPVLVPGVFHPKCTYLSGPDGDLLLVGSGNLTFGGYGRNVEVLEVLQPETHPQAFLDFADFLESLVSRPRLEIPNPDCVGNFVQSARSAVRADIDLTNTGTIRLLHSANEPIVDQLAAYCGPHGGVENVTVLSPFHDANGSAMAELANATQCRELRIALPPNPGQTSTFPFHLAHDLNLRVTAVRPKLQKATRRTLHAKWIEVATLNGTVTLTGSVNATYPALCTTRNIEVGIIRHSNLPPDRWEPASIPVTFEIEPEPPVDSARPALVYTRLTAGGKITGHVMSQSEMNGEWRLRFEKTGHIYLDTSVQVDRKGQFTGACENTNQILSAGTIRVVLTRDENRAIGWLEMDELVRMSLEQRSLFGALSRFLSKQATDDDDVSLLNYLAISSSHHLDDLAPEDLPASSASGEELRGSGDDSIVSLDRIAPTDRDPERDRLTAFTHPTANTLAHWFRQFRKQLLSPETLSSPRQANGPKRVAHPSENDEEAEDLQDQERTSRALDAFDGKMLHTLYETPNAEARRKLLCIWHEVTIYMLCQRLGMPEECPVFLRRWLGYVHEFVSAREIPEPLERYFFTSVAILGFYGMQEGSGRTLQSLHESLEGFGGRQITLEYAIGALDRRWEQGIARGILGIDDPTLDIYLNKVLSTRTSLDEIQEIITSIGEHRPVDFTSGIFNTVSLYGRSIGAELRSRIEDGSALRFLVPRMDERFDSSCCYYRFSENEKASYAIRRIAKCPSCGKFNVRLHP
jgi:hypothetical protein